MPRLAAALRRHRIALPAAAGALLFAAVTLTLWRPPLSRGPESDLAALDLIVDEKIAGAGAGARDRIADLFAPGEAAEVAAADLDLGGEGVSEAIDRIEGILDPSEIGGLPDLEEILEGLSGDQVKELLGEIRGAGIDPARVPADGGTG